MNKGKRLRAHYLFTIPIALIYTIFFIVPLIVGIFYSLTDWNGLTSTFSFIGLENYIMLFKDSNTYKTLSFTIKYAILFSIGSGVISLGLGLLLNQKFKGRSFVRSIYFFPAVVSGVIVGMLFSEIYYRALPALGNALNIEILSKSIAANPNTAIYAILIANLWQGVALPTAIIIAGLQSIDETYYEVAAMDGANWFWKFTRITLPFVIPTLTMVSVLAIKNGLLVFDYVLAITSGGPAGVTTPIGLYVYRIAFSNFKYSYSLANSTLLFVLIALFGFGYIKLLGLLEAKQ